MGTNNVENLAEFAVGDNGGYNRALKYLENNTPKLCGVIDRIVGNLYEKWGILQEDAKPEPIFYVCGKLKDSYSRDYPPPVSIEISRFSEDGNSILVRAMIAEPVSLHEELKFVEEMYMGISREVTIERGNNGQVNVITQLYRATITRVLPCVLPHAGVRLESILRELAKKALIHQVDYQRLESTDIATQQKESVSV